MAINEYKTRVVPPNTPSGILRTTAPNFEINPKMIATSAAARITKGEKIRVTDYYIYHFLLATR